VYFEIVAFTAIKKCCNVKCSQNGLASNDPDCLICNMAMQSPSGLARFGDMQQRWAMSHPCGFSLGKLTVPSAEEPPT
jgi:hypothetical protein